MIIEIISWEQQQKFPPLSTSPVVMLLKHRVTRSPLWSWKVSMAPRKPNLCSSPRSTEILSISKRTIFTGTSERVWGRLREARLSRRLKRKSLGCSLLPGPSSANPTYSLPRCSPDLAHRLSPHMTLSMTLSWAQPKGCWREWDPENESHGVLNLQDLCPLQDSSDPITVATRPLLFSQTWSTERTKQ